MRNNEALDMQPLSAADVPTAETVAFHAYEVKLREAVYANIGRASVEFVHGDVGEPSAFVVTWKLLETARYVADILGRNYGGPAIEMTVQATIDPTQPLRPQVVALKERIAEAKRYMDIAVKAMALAAPAKEEATKQPAPLAQIEDD